MAPQQFVQKPYKVTGEQYRTGMVPPDANTRDGLCICRSPLTPTGAPHVHGLTRLYVLNDTDWVMQEQWSPHDWFVVSDAEKQDRF
jgi:hypothetical protein